jgi:hypothetical protein
MSWESFLFPEWPMALGGRWGSIYSPHLKRAIGGSFHRTSLVELSGSRSRLDKAGPSDEIDGD